MKLNTGGEVAKVRGSGNGGRESEVIRWWGGGGRSYGGEEEEGLVGEAGVGISGEHCVVSDGVSLRHFIEQFACR